MEMDLIVHPSVGFRTSVGGSLATILLALTPAAAFAFQSGGSIHVDPVAPMESTAIVEADRLYAALDAAGALQRLEIRLEVEPDDFEARGRRSRWR